MLKLRARVNYLFHNPHTHYTIVACIAIMFVHDGAKLADWLWVVLALACESNGGQS